MESNRSIPAKQESELTLKSLILRLQEWTRYLWKKWLIIGILGLIGAILGLVYALVKKPEYIAELTFVLEDSKQGTLGAYAGLASQFGIDLGLSSGSGVFSGDNIIEFLKSRLMVEKTLLSPVIINGKQESLANLYIDKNEIRKSWENEPTLKDLRLPYNVDRQKFSLQQDSILHLIHKKIIEDNLSVTKPDKKLSFISVKCVTKDEMFSKLFTERLVREATDFYVQTKTKRSKTNIDKLQEKADSLEALLNKKTYSVAASQDLNFNPARSIAEVKTELETRHKMVLQTMFGEVVKNLELSRMSMAQETPIIQIVDIPILPLERKKFGKLKGLISGGILSSFMVVVFLIIRKIYKEVMIKN